MSCSQVIAIPPCIWTASAATFENANSTFLKAVGFDKTADRPIYSFTAPTSVVSPIFSPTTSRWRIQLGARYQF